MNKIEPSLLHAMLIHWIYIFSQTLGYLSANSLTKNIKQKHSNEFRFKSPSAYVLWWAASTHDQEVFSFYPENRPCNGFEEALERYREIGEIVHGYFLTGPTYFAPIIETAGSWTYYQIVAFF